MYTEKQVEENNENNAFVWLNNCSKLYVKKWAILKEGFMQYPKDSSHFEICKNSIQ